MLRLRSKNERRSALPDVALTAPYTPEVNQHLIRAVIAVAAFAGLREGEIRGQWWEDDEGHILNIQRSVWRTHVKFETKTHEDEDDPGVPDTVIQAILRHTDVGTTQRFYIKTVREDVKDAMKQLERKIHRAAVVQQPDSTGLVN